MMVRHCLLLLLALALGCLRSPLPADAPATAAAVRTAARTQEPLEAVRLGGPGLRGLDLARLPERALEATAAAPAGEPLLAQEPPAREVVDKSRARVTDPVPPATRPEEVPAPPATKEVTAERRPFLRPALAEASPGTGPGEAQAGRPQTPPPGATPSQASAAPRDLSTPPPPATIPSSPPPRPQPQPTPEPQPEREILAPADRPVLASGPESPARAGEAAPTPAVVPPRNVVEAKPAAEAAPPAKPQEPLLAEVRQAPVLRTPGGGTELAPVDEEEEARPPRPTAPPDARFQVQIMSASDPEGADDMRLQAELVFPDEVVEVVWDPPYYKVRVGAEANQEGAVELKRRALRLGFQNAWVVPRRQP